ncbi:MAG: DUF4197 domain-containing protein [Hylemonella sp.]|nr:DUF4197 domain-containing protein [Hylemonella sp.]
MLQVGSAQALTLEDLSQGEAVRALKAALERGARSAIGQLGQLNGFLGNEKVRIPLPRQLQDAEQMLRTFGQGGRLDELVTTMNRAAEAAVPMAQELMLGAVRGMTVADGKKILGGDETSVTTFFADKTRLPLGQKFLPVVTRSTEKVGLAGQYNQIAGKAADFGLLRREDASIEQYVTAKALDGLYYVIGEEERKIRRDPVATGSALLSKVFGALK